MENHDNKPVDPQSEKGLSILKHAFSEGGKVLEFKNNNGDLTVLDITEHHRELQAMADQEQ